MIDCRLGAVARLNAAGAVLTGIAVAHSAPRPWMNKSASPQRNRFEQDSIGGMRTLRGEFS